MVKARGYIIEKYCVCVRCGIRFMVGLKARQYCGGGCSQAAYRDRKMDLLINRK